MVLEFISGQMEEDMKEDGKMESRMEKVKFFTVTEQ